MTANNLTIKIFEISIRMECIYKFLQNNTPTNLYVLSLFSFYFFHFDQRAKKFITVQCRVFHEGDNISQHAIHNILTTMITLLLFFFQQ